LSNRPDTCSQTTNVSFRNDFTATMQEVYALDEHGKRTGIRPALKADLRSFAHTWFRNLRAQEFLSPSAQREVLSRRTRGGLELRFSDILTVPRGA